MVSPLRIREAREQLLGRTQQELANQLGLANGVTVSRWERGVVEPQLRHLRALAALADVKIAWFFAEDGVAA